MKDSHNLNIDYTQRISSQNVIVAGRIPSSQPIKLSQESEESVLSHDELVSPDIKQPLAVFGSDTL